jgi:membrane protease YdiL (CAAX protease family)
MPPPLQHVTPRGAPSVQGDLAAYALVPRLSSASLAASVVLGGVAIGVGSAVFGPGARDAVFGGIPGEALLVRIALISTLVSAAVVCPAITFRGVSFRDFIAPQRPVDIRLWFVGAVAPVGLAVLALLIARLFAGTGWEGYWPSAFHPIIILAVIWAAAMEEILFRGWLLRVATAVLPTRARVLVAVAAIFWLTHIGYHGLPSLLLLALGLVLADVALRSGGVEFSAGYHAAHNLVIMEIISKIPNSRSTFSVEIVLLSAAIILSPLLGYYLLGKYLRARRRNI